MTDRTSTPTTVKRRPATPADEGLLRDLFAETRADLSLLDPELRGTLVDLQWRAREREYAAVHPDAIREILVADGTDVGQLILADTADAVRVVDVSVHARHRGRGIGSSVLRDVTREAEHRGRRVRLSVWSENSGARRLYESLGFVAVEAPEDGAGYIEMSRSGDG